jgi:amino acid permease
MSDLQLITIPIPGQPEYPPQQVPGPFFGEQTNDLVIDSSNDFALVSGLQETVQDVQKILLTEQGTPITLFPLYGTTLQSLIGNKVNPNTISGSVQQQITQALQVLYLLTQNRSNPAEIVQTLYSLNVSLQSETNIAALLTVIAMNNEEITTGVNVGSI